MDDDKDVLFDVPDITVGQLNIEYNPDKKIVVALEKDKYHTDESNTLQLIINAIKLDFKQDIILIKLERGQQISLTSVIPAYKDILIFGLSPADLGFFVDYNPYDILQFENVRMLVSESLTELNNAKPKKALLWGKLQAMYISH